MSWVRIWVHMVFTTKNHHPLINTRQLRETVFSHIKENAGKKDIWLDSIGGHSNHIHCLVSLGREQTISSLAQLIKGESSFWINREKLIRPKFEWQDDYWAVSVSESHTDAVRSYIANQEEHHRKVSFEEEVKEFMEKYGWSHFK